MRTVKLSLVAVFVVCAGVRGAAVCIVSTSGVAFGNYNSLGGQSAYTNGTISVTCTGTTGDSASYTITVNSGLGSFAARKMYSGSDSLLYNIYKDSGCTQVLGDGSASTVTLSDAIVLTSSSATKNYVVYSRIASGQKAAKAHIYGDNLLVNLTY